MIPHYVSAFVPILCALPFPSLFSLFHDPDSLISDFYSFSAVRAFYGLEERVKRLINYLFVL